jgi:hypothetical protein
LIAAYQHASELGTQAATDAQRYAAASVAGGSHGTLTTQTTKGTIMIDFVKHYGYERVDAGIRCESCGATFPAAEGSVMRSHAKRCPANPREYHVPAACDA